ncbi:hypothetical protein FP435_05410 [Lactobacillus sp. PV037]|uniref:SLAP domain-containing protein n=1 Tax=unclassified Lactobacillus TaxID=2620435 RepID=UPI00223EC939|nr:MULTISPECIES: SLAP domain-containing protein [unclassified Lactobacillus]QNQ82040.1 hypothetical protein FP433_02835 [Lactobacillus sp. PV012]QNQ83925.1 hypothetical protein FP435_05410 [Lactobacillus sp. PV037]
MNKKKKTLKLVAVSFLVGSSMASLNSRVLATTINTPSSNSTNNPSNSLEIKDNMTLSQIYKELEDDNINDGSLPPNELSTQLKQQGISVAGNRILGKPQGFTITLSKQQTGKDEDTSVIFGTGKPENLIDNSILKANYSENGKEKSESISGNIFLIDEGSKFDPLDIKASNGITYQVASTDKADGKVVSNTVDSTKANSWGVVTVSTTTKSGKETEASYAVYVRNDKPVRLNVPYYTSIYDFNSVENNNFLNDPATISRGTEIYIGKNFMNAGSHTYNSISTQSLAIANNKEEAAWMSTANLLTDTKPIEAVEKTVMHRSLVYSQGGGSKYRHIAAFKKVTVEKEPYTFKGVKYYKIIDAPDYIKVANVDGTKRKLKHNAYIYATSTKRADRTVLKKGTVVTTYGGSYKFKNGKQYYRIQGATATKKRYVKVANFE